MICRCSVDAKVQKLRCPAMPLPHMQHITCRDIYVKHLILGMAVHVVWVAMGLCSEDLWLSCQTSAS
jgi:hypothetical protein